MKKIKIVADSSANVLQLQYTDFAAAPLKIITNDKEFIDDRNLDVAGMVSWFDSYKGKSKTSCPNPSDWLEAFADANSCYYVNLAPYFKDQDNSLAGHYCGDMYVHMNEQGTAAWANLLKAYAEGILP